jgi:hypothetical protein
MRRMARYQALVLQLALRRIARAERAARPGLHIVPEAPDGPADQSPPRCSRQRRTATGPRLVHSSAAKSGSIQLVRAVHDWSRSRE